jgi:hypothetical protein
MQGVILISTALLLLTGSVVCAEEDIVAIHKSVLEKYRTGGSPVIARIELEKFGIKNILKEKPANLTTQQYANILNDYAFFLTYPLSFEGLRLSIGLLERVVKLTPERTVAHLNLADAYRSSIRFLDYTGQLKAAEKAVVYYKRYLRTAKKKLQRADQFFLLNPAHQSKFKSACHYVAEFMNSGRLEEIAFQGDRIDIDNDGQMDKVKTRVEGTANEEVLEVNFGAEEGGHEVQYFGDYEIKVIPFQGKQYVVYANGNSLRAVKLIIGREEDAQKVICTFNQKVVRTVQQSSGLPICQIVQQGGDLDYVKFDDPHSYAGKPFSGGMETGFSIDADKGSCNVDIDNDGAVEPVVPLTFLSGGGRGCAFTYLAVLNKNKSELSVSRTARLLYELQGVGPSGPSSLRDIDNCDGLIYKPFRWNNETFIEAKVEGPLNPFHEIWQIKGGTVTSICKYKMQIQNIVQ